MKKPDHLTKVLFAVIGIFIIGIGLLSILSGHAPARPTRFGIAGPLDGMAAEKFGFSLVFLGIIPLLVLSGKKNIVAIGGTICAIAMMTTLFL